MLLFQVIKSKQWQTRSLWPSHYRVHWLGWLCNQWLQAFLSEFKAKSLFNISLFFLIIFDAIRRKFGHNTNCYCLAKLSAILACDCNAILHQINDGNLENYTQDRSWAAEATFDLVCSIDRFMMWLQDYLARSVSTQQQSSEIVE